MLDRLAGIRGRSHRAGVHLPARLIQSGDYRKNEDNLNPRAAESRELWVMSYE